MGEGIGSFLPDGWVKFDDVPAFFIGKKPM